MDVFLGTQKKQYNTSLTLISLMYLTWGFITVINGVLIAELQIGLQMTLVQTHIITYLFFGTYFVMGFPAGKLVDKVGYKKSIIIGLYIAASATLLMVPGAMLRNYYLVIAGIFVIATGITLLQVAVNPYLVLFLGNSKNAVTRLVTAGAFNSIGTWLAPLIGIIVISGEMPIDDSFLGIAQAKAEVVINPYILFSCIFIGLAIILNFSSLPEISTTKHLKTNIKDDNRKWVLQYKHVVFAAIGIFAYVGAEVGIGMKLSDFIIDDLGLTQFEGVEGLIVAFYWGSMMVGRFMAANYIKNYSPQKVTAYFAFCAAALVFIAISADGLASMIALIAVGFFNSVLFCTIFVLGVSGMGKFSEEASAVMIMAIVGGGVIYYIMNQFDSIKMSLYVPFICYLVIIAFGKWGYKYEEKDVIELAEAEKE